MPRHTCPTEGCAARWAQERMVTESTLPGGPILVSLTVTCERGHTYDVVGYAQDLNDVRAYRVIVPKPPAPSAGFVNRHCEGPCKGCGKPVQPGQAFVPEGTGGRHLGC